MIAHKVLGLLNRAKNFGALSFLPTRSQFLLSLLFLVKSMFKIKPIPYVKIIKVPSKIGDIFLSGNSLYVDLVIFDDIFVREIYKADYQNASVIDVGAHKGYYAAFALKEGAKKVTAFEPEGNNFNCLAQSTRFFKEHGYKIEIHNACVGSRSGEVTLYSTDESLSHSLFLRTDKKIVQKERVQMIDFPNTLSKMVSESEGNVILKINAEGAECDIILNSELLGRLFHLILKRA